MASFPRCTGGIRSLEFRGPAAGYTRVNKIPMPAGVSVTWSDGRCDAFCLEGLDAGASRDVLASPDAPYVLKVQGERWHRSENPLGQEGGRSCNAVSNYVESLCG